MKTTKKQREELRKELNAQNVPESMWLVTLLDDLDKALTIIDRLEPYIHDVEKLEAKILGLEQQLAESKRQAKRLATEFALRQRLAWDYPHSEEEKETHEPEYRLEWSKGGSDEL